MTLEDTLRTIIREELAAITQPAPPKHPIIMDRIECAAFLKIHPSTLGRLVKKGLPVNRLGKSPRFNRDDVAAWLGRQCKTTAEPGSEARSIVDHIMSKRVVHS